MNVVEHIAKSLGPAVHRVVESGDWAWDEWFWEKGKTRLEVTRNTSASPYVVTLRSSVGKLNVQLGGANPPLDTLDGWVKYYLECTHGL